VKRVGELFEQVVTLDNLLSAFRCDSLELRGEHEGRAARTDRRRAVQGRLIRRDGPSRFPLMPSGRWYGGDAFVRVHTSAGPPALEDERISICV
jgi:hypothetical protein